MDFRASRTEIEQIKMITEDHKKTVSKLESANKLLNSEINKRVKESVDANKEKTDAENKLDQGQELYFHIF